MAELITALQLAERLNLTPSTIRQWARLGFIPSIKISHKVTRFEWENVVEALKTRAEVSDRRGCDD